METMWFPRADEILSAGEPLSDLGIRNWALTRPQALVALGELEAEDIAVLGGDVLVKSAGRMRMSDDSWSCDREPGEPFDDFVRRSVGCARAYIIRYPEGVRDPIYFALVPK